jgi:outer membrane protein assembly factor BamB
MFSPVLRRTGLGLLLAAAVALFPAASRSHQASKIVIPSNWLSYGHDAGLTNSTPAPSLTPTAMRRLATVWTKQLDGPIVASPLYANGTLYAETEAGSVYALQPSDGTVRWKRTFGVVATPGCGSWGFSSTGAIDLKRGLLYAISADGFLHALSLVTGAERAGWPVSITSAHADGEYVWGGLRLFGNRVYVPVASYCDSPGSDGVMPNGKLVAVDVVRAAVAETFDPVPGEGNLGGIWGWGGVSVDSARKRLFTGVGNSHVYDPACSCYTDTAGLGNAMVKLTPQLRVLGWNRPKHTPGTGDYDLGTAPLLFQPPGCPPLLAGNGKLGRLYVWNRNHLKSGPRFSVVVSDGIAAFVGQPSYSRSLNLLFESHATVTRKKKKVGDGIAAYSIDSRCRFHRRWLTSIGVGEEPPPLVLGDVVFGAGGDRGGFVALAARTGKFLWRLKTPRATISPPIAAGGRIFAGDFGGTLRAFAPAMRHRRR